MKYKTSKEIREIWIRFFKERNHKVESSSPLVPINDNSLLWINAGIAPLKKYFDGREVPPSRRIVNIQKCLRTNDIENVGKTARHHTFFEMLGNFSIGDYFKEEAVSWGMEILTSKEYFGFDLEKLYFTVYETDHETALLWQRLGVKKEKIIFLKNNFWEIGEGPCGPCTEIFYDRGPAFDKRGKELIEQDLENDRYIEIWNIVFSQYNSKEGLMRKDYPELPAKNIDTGMGFERLVAIIQNAKTNFETDLFLPIIEEISILSKKTYNGEMAFKVIADHARTLTMAIADGAILSNEGRGYVLRRVLRRALKHARHLGFDKPIVYLLVDKVVKIMQSAYPNIREKAEIIKEIIRKEEEKFLQTLASGEKKLMELAKKAKIFFPPEEAFLLYDTYGFPVELTIEYLEEFNLQLDLDNYQRIMQEQKDNSRKSMKKQDEMQIQNEEFIQFKDKSEFIGYDNCQKEAKVIKIFPQGIVLDQTPFYAEQGGQAADKGKIDTQAVLDVFKLPNGQHCHKVESPEDFIVGKKYLAAIDLDYRLNVARNHSAAHLLHAALKSIVGSHANQQGSQVEEKSFRFDFNNYQSLDEKTLLAIEAKVLEDINLSHSVITKLIKKEEADKLGAIALFDEKYGAKVRMVDMNSAKELCSGTHVSNTKEIGSFAILEYSSIGSGIYRIEATTGPALKSALLAKTKNIDTEINNLKIKAESIIETAKIKNISLSFTTPKTVLMVESYNYYLQVRESLSQMKEAVKRLEKEFERLSGNNAIADIKKYLDQIVSDRLVIKTEDLAVKELKSLADALHNAMKQGTVFIVGLYEEKLIFIAKTNTNNASDLVKKACAITNGSGGGRNDFAQGGSAQTEKLEQVMALINQELS
ncbi:MAG: alanine--tRNA ligase [Erysipelotrichales bacterium]|nr:alanine--tRNA ligase [Erysipelotrichales bacterium]